MELENGRKKCTNLKMPVVFFLGSDIVQWLTKNLSIEDPGNFSFFFMSENSSLSF